MIDLRVGKRKGRYAVLDVTTRKDRRPRVLALSTDRSLVRLSPAELRKTEAPVAHVRVPEGFDARDPRARKQLAQRLTALGEIGPPVTRRPRGGSPAELLARIEAHPCHGCPERRRHLHFAKREARLAREIASLDRRIRRRTGTLARRFELVLEILRARGYVEGWRLTEKGNALRRVYNEADLLLVEALERGLLGALEPADMAAVVSSLVYEPRGPEGDLPTGMPTAASRAQWNRLTHLWTDIRALEEARGLDLTRQPEPGFAERAYLWASGAMLDEVLDEDDAPGDFVRVVKQLVDLLRQLEVVAPDEASHLRVRRAVGGLNRGVVALSSSAV